MAKQKKISFEDYYIEIYKDRWETLKQGLLAEAEGFCISEGLLKPYYLDKASAAAARALEVRPGDSVLDMCAAPGGKTLVLALALSGSGNISSGSGGNIASGSLVSNDRSSDRRRRLKDVIETHLPAEVRSAVTVTGHDAARWGLHEKDCYDRILLDAPCSSEEHVLKSPAHLKKWSPSRTKQLSIQAHAMLASAVDALKPGGTLVYSTCALSPLENDGVIEKLLKKRADRVLVDRQVEVQLGLKADKTQYGLHILPDLNQGYGPIFLARFTKTK